MGKLHDTDEVIDRIRFIIDNSRMSQAAFARFLDVDPAYLSRILSGKLALTEGFINKIVIDTGVSKQWLVTGKDLPYGRSRQASTLVARVEPEEQSKGIPVYDIDVAAGMADFDRMFTSDNIMGYVNMPQINPDCVIVRVNGDSMTPTIQPGSFIAIRRISPSGLIYWGQIYVIVTENFRMVKFIRRHHDDSMITLHSDNPHYDDIEMPRSQVQALYIVETIINYNRRC